METLRAWWKKQHWEFPLLLLLVCIGYLLIHDLAGGTLFAHDPYDSYTLQAIAWLKGETCLANGQNYTWLELAIYQGNYFVSFPPLPSVVMVPFVLFFGENTPNNLIVLGYVLFSLWGAYRACRTAMEPGHACFWALFAVLACNMLEVGSNGGVWLQAQALNMALLLWGVNCALRNRRTLCLFLLALAVGCRPFSIFYLPVALIYFRWQDKTRGWSLRQTLYSCWKGLLLAAAFGALLMWYNFIRFGNPLEFGHNYLPEFLEAENGQFHLSYLWPNLLNILRPVGLNADGSLSYPLFNGFLFFLVNPLFLVWFVQLVRDLRRRRMTLPMVACFAGFLLNLLCLCLHKTFGGYQFGARYTLDMLPYALFCLILAGRQAPARWEKFLCAFGLLFNAYGTVVMRLKLRG